MLYFKLIFIHEVGVEGFLFFTYGYPIVPALFIEKKVFPIELP